MTEASQLNLMFAPDEAGGDFHDGRNRIEEAYYFCQCDRLSRICQGTHPTPGGRWFGIGHSSTSSGLRQSYAMKTRQRWILMVFILAALLLLLVLLFGGGGGRGRGVKPLQLHLDLDELTERGLCPACFGVNLCPQMLQGDIKLSDWSKYSVMKLMNSKNVFYADWNLGGKEVKLVLKKLGHDHELDELDKTICERHGQRQDPDSCDVRTSVQYLIQEYSHHSEVHPGDEILHGGKIGKGSDILLCPSERKMGYLISAAKKFNKGQNPKTILANVLTTILLNPEPLILEAFSSKDGWPFPKYYGSCGRIVAEGYVGRSLTQYAHESFRTRAHLGRQLLQMANQFGDNPSNFVLYMLDPSPDNFAVSEESNTLKMIDLENIIVVDKEQLLESTVKDADKLLVSEATDCKKNDKDAVSKCFSFSTDDLCIRRLTDHNFYAVCAGILAPDPLTADLEFPLGLLHSLPENDKHKLPQLSELLQQCKDPSLGSLNLTRIEAAQALLRVLGDYLDTTER